MKDFVMTGPIRENRRAKERELELEWQKLLARHGAPLERGAKAKGVKTFRLQNVKKPGPVAIVRSTANIPSLGTTSGSATKAPPKVYTGTKTVGIATMHKSNMVPIFNEGAAVEVAQMRRN